MSWFKRKSEKEVLQKKYEKLMKDWHRLSTIDRKASDDKYAEAQLIAEKMENL